MVRLLLALLLTAAQGTILGLALFAPRVSATHRAMYHERTIDCRAQEGGIAFPAAETIRPVSLEPDLFCRLLPRGWSVEQPFGRASRGAWSTRADPEIKLPIQAMDRAVALTLRGYAPGTGSQRVTLQVDDTAPQNIAVPHQGLRTICLPVPARGTGIRIRMTIATPTRPALAGDGNDPRATGLELVEIRRARNPGCGL